MTPWLGVPRPAGLSLIGVSEPNSILEVFTALARRSRVFGVGWLANRQGWLTPVLPNCNSLRRNYWEDINHIMFWQGAGWQSSFLLLQYVKKKKLKKGQ